MWETSFPTKHCGINFPTIDNKQDLDGVLWLLYGLQINTDHDPGNVKETLNGIPAKPDIIPCDKSEITT